MTKRTRLRDEGEWIRFLGREKLLEIAEQMISIRQFELRAEAAYQKGKIGGFFHSYIGQEAIQTAAVNAMGREGNWWVTSYRCHALALLLGVTVEEAMAELYGRATGNVLGRGGSMHLHAERMLGGCGIVGGQIPLGTGAAFSLKYRGEGGVAICFLGEGAVAQGTFHESLNLASLWELPCVYVIENNRWGMGTAVDRAIAVQPIAEHFAGSYGISTYTLDGMDFFDCYDGFSRIYREVSEKRCPILVEVIAERFRGHSISDPALYREREELEKARERDPILLFTKGIKRHKIASDRELRSIEEAQKAKVIAAMEVAENSPLPDVSDLEEGVFAPESP